MNDKTLPSMLQKIVDMHDKFNIKADQVEFSQREKQFRIDCLSEEVSEYTEADTPEEELDALVDLVVFAFGSAERQGMIDVFEEAFNRVMAANMKKELGPNDKRGSFQIDLVKPEGWEAPCLKDLVKKS